MSRRGVELAQEEMELMKRIYEEGGE
jgi:hypothetical protein